MAWLPLIALLLGVIPLYEGIRLGSVGRLGRPLCAVAPPRLKRAEHGGGSNDHGNNTFIVLPERSERVEHDSLGKVTIGKHHCGLVEGGSARHLADASSGHGEAAQLNRGNTIYMVRNDYKIGLEQLKNESIYDKRRNHFNLLELAKIALQADGVVVPLDYDKLMANGPDMYQLRLLDVMLFILREMGNVKLNLHFLVYNYKERQRYNSARNEFYARREKEIEESLSHLVKHKSDVIDVVCTFSAHNKLEEYLKALEPWLDKCITLKQACPNEFKREAERNAGISKKLVRMQEFMSASVNDVAARLKNVDFAKDAKVFHQLLEQANAVELGFNAWMQEHAATLAELPDKLKERVDTLVSTLLSEFDSQTRTIARDSQPHWSAVRRKLVESLQNKLAFMMDNLALKIHDTVLQEFQTSLQTLPVDEHLDSNLQDAIGKYDSRYCALVDGSRFDLLKGNALYQLKAQMQRRDMIDSMKEVANHVLEFAIAKGMFHANFSLLDGISYIPSSFLKRMLFKLVKKLKMPLHISLNYLSPTAFGFSNLFRDTVALKPGILRYFTGDREHKMFSQDKTTRQRANSLVHSEQ